MASIGDEQDLSAMSTRKAFGDFQTPERLATKVTALVDDLFGTPELVIEPTVGLGAFLKASAERWGDKAEYLGYDINENYVSQARKSLKRYRAQILQRDFFSQDWCHNISTPAKRRVLVIGNPPWVTNSDLGQLGSSNLPKKSNFQGLRGFDARTGKSNFDIAEWMLIKLIDALPPDGAIAMLCKTMTARKVLRHLWKTNGGRLGSSLFHIDAKAEFDVAVDACLFFATGKRTDVRSATVHAGLDAIPPAARFGLVDGELVADIDAYQSNRFVGDDVTLYTWRSGVKHDAAKIMEFTRESDVLINGFGDVVDIEEEYVFPLLKSSDIGNGRIESRKAALVTQRHTGDDTAGIETKAPRTWQYLKRHERVLDERRSSIYRGRPRFSVFGIGPYSFSPWKVAISGLYKEVRFTVVPPFRGRPVMVDDTCYFIPCKCRKEAELVCELLSSAQARAFLRSLVFPDSKRPITIDVLRRVSITELARQHGKLEDLMKLSGFRSRREQGRLRFLHSTERT